MSTPELPQVDAPTLDKLIEWTTGYLQRKRNLQVIAENERERNFALDLWTGLLSTLAELKKRRAEDPTENEQGPMWIPSLEVDRMMKQCREGTSEKVEIDRKTLEGLLHDSQLWRKDRQAVTSERPQSTGVRLGDVFPALLDSTKSPAPPKRNEAIEAYVSQFNIDQQPSKREAFADGWDACYMQRPQRARVGTLEVGATEDRREVVINAPFTPDNGTGFVHFAFTPRQAIGLAETLFRKSADCLPQFARDKGAERHPTLVNMALSRATTLRGTHITNPEHEYIVALADSYLAAVSVNKLWQGACTGRHGSQEPCVRTEKKT